MRASLRDLRIIAEALVLIAVTWVLLGWYFDHPITQLDGAAFVTPYTRSQLAAGGDWTEHLYRFGVLGGAPMHPYAGTLPLVQLAAWLGLSTTATVNAGTLFLQLCFAVFAVVAVEAVAGQLRTADRIATMLLAAFAPVLAWRLTLGHENIVQGTLPFVVASTLLVAARGGRLTLTALVLGWFAVWNGVSGLGGQLVSYSAVFGLPVLATIAWTTRPWTRAHLAVVLACAAGVLVALPRLVPMLQFAASDDASRRLGDSVMFEYGPARWIDWLGSIPWTRASAGGALPHEANYPIGPLVVLIVALWPRGDRRWIALAASLVLAILFASDLLPHASIIPPLASFRVPARAVLPIVVVLPIVAAALYYRARPGVTSRHPVGIAMVIIGTHALVPPLVHEVLAGIAACLLVWRPKLPGLAVVAALGVCAFGQRVPRGTPADPIEDGPGGLYASVVAQVPGLAMPLDRIEIVDAPPPYRVGLGFAAGLSTLDGDFNPPRRFVRLVSLLSGRELPSTTVIFSLARNPAFPVLQQLYNVTHGLVPTARGHELQAFPPTLGPAWVPRAVAVGDRPDIRALDVAVVDDPALAGPCSGRVTSVIAAGQRATITAVSENPCVVVVATNYVGMLRARTPSGVDLRVVPVDVALTGVVVPRGATTFTLAPEVAIPLSARLAALVGWLLLGVGCVLACASPASAPDRDRRGPGAGVADPLRV
jgi:hypothetical protein